MRDRRGRCRSRRCSSAFGPTLSAIATRGPRRRRAASRHRVGRDAVGAGLVARGSGGGAARRARRRGRRRASRSRGPRARRARARSGRARCEPRGLAPIAIQPRERRRRSAAASRVRADQVDEVALDRVRRRAGRHRARARRTRACCGIVAGAPGACAVAVAVLLARARGAGSLRSSSARRVVDEHLHQEAVELRLGQRVGALLLDRVLRRHAPGRAAAARRSCRPTVTWRSSIASSSADCTLAGRAVDLVGQHDVAEDRDRAGTRSAPPSCCIDLGAGHVGRQQVRA